MLFNLAHRMAIIDFFAAIRALVELQIRDGVFFTFIHIGPVAPGQLNILATTGWTIVKDDFHVSLLTGSLG